MSSYLFVRAVGFDFEARPRATKDALDAFQKDKRLNVRLQMLIHHCDGLNILRHQGTLMTVSKRV